ncbi:DUF4040 domain-containing protein [Aquihabitans sp. G128]|uniref:hydrogen gas-evolving membrane-bound hydrogenase subunit E n=1 Tax=Aquihabitans sp. G128 TaxID=2849779 RepID=UPI001C22BF26|nr:hydrogen gas-evolving membrane-bound hydrogenase subunit E [Aquihabitans sp. G128]QXC59660.1 DUF4040 domain-containing protein [Aquihabitans sp. G128]
MHAALGLALLAGGRRLGRRSFLVAALSPAAALAWAVAHAGGIVDGDVIHASQTWVPALHLSLDLRIDGFSLLLVLLVTGIGLLVQLYASQYFAAGRAGLHRLAGLLLVFTAAMLGVVTAANLLALYVAWELTSVTSYLLIGWTDEDPKARASALQALLTTGAGGLAMLGGFVLIGQSAGTYDLAALAARPPTGTTVSVGLVLVLVGAFTKSAQFPFSAWLPGAMVAPTPVSAFLHSATMVKAGVYLIARLAPVFADQGIWRPLVLSVGLVTMLTGGWRALRQHDLKRILAFGTVSQLGFLVVLFGVGTPEATEAGVVLLLAHALFKACLFLVVGVIDHQAHTRDIRALGRYGPGWLGPKVVAVAAGASMAGIPLLFGFVAKESAYDAFAHGGVTGSGVVLAGLVAGSVLTFAYTGRLLLGAFVPTRPGSAPASGAVAPIEPPPAPALAFWAPAALLGTLTLVLGLVPGLASGLVSSAADSLDPGVHPVHLALWHGVGRPLVLSGLTLALGALLVAGRVAVARVQSRVPHPVDGDAAYLGLVRGLNRVADRVTGFVQPGSLPVYTGVILLTAVVVPGFALLRSPFPDLPPLATGPGDWAAAGLLIVGGVAATVVRERMAAVLCLGAVGYGMALVFVLQGAPDLALTQVCIDTLGAVVFVLVLRHLPKRFNERPTVIGRTARLVISALVGVFVFVFIVVAVGVRVEPPVSTAFIDRALTEGGGRNVVNVVIVDIRGFDTMGEITVLAVAAIGVYSLARLSRREGRELRSFAPLRGPSSKPQDQR